MPAAMHKVCFDLTLLMTSSRFRGMGKNYSLELARAFGRVAASLDGIDLHLLLGPNLSLRVARYREELLEAEARNDAGIVLPDPAHYALRHTAGSARLLFSGIDLYHSPSPKGTPNPPRCKVVVTCHDLIPVMLRYPFDPRILPTSFRAVVERVRYRPFDHVIAISECSRRDLIDVTGYPSERVDVIYQGVDRDVYCPEAGARDAELIAGILGSDRPFFVYVGGFDRRKQVPEMVEAFGRRAREIDEVLVVCGKIAPLERAKIEEKIRSTGARGRVVMPGFVPDESLPALYRGATAHVMLSVYEGFGATLVEALSCGCPLVAANASCVPEIVEDAGLLVEPGSIDAAGEAMVQVSRDRALRSSLRERGFRRVEFFDWDRCARETIETYRRVLGS